MLLLFTKLHFFCKFFLILGSDSDSDSDSDLESSFKYDKNSINLFNLSLESIKSICLNIFLTLVNIVDILSVTF